MPERLPPRGKPGPVEGGVQPATAAGQFDLFGAPNRRPEGGPRILTVGELTRQIKSLLEGRFAQLLVRGEVSNVKIPSSGHVYFTLKDEEACLEAVLFAKEARRLRFTVRGGMSLLARGRLSLWEPQGRYQLVCDGVEPLGSGALQIAFEQLKEKLQREGLFDSARKRRLPFLPRRIALVTSPSGAAVHDFLRVLHRRFPNLPVLIVPVRVQGEGAAGEIARGIARAAQQRGVEVVVIARGGGSLEDLWAFNEEVVARALAACPVPTVSAIGHEVDVTIADFAADVRAPTPTAAAELLARVKDELIADVAQRRARLVRAMGVQLERRRAALHRLRAGVADPRRLIADRRLRLDKLETRLVDALRAGLSRRRAAVEELGRRLALQHPRERLHRLHRELDRLRERLTASTRRGLAARRRPHEGLLGRLDNLNPLKVLARGYAIAFDASGHALRSASDARPGDPLRIRLGDGELAARVVPPHEPAGD